MTGARALPFAFTSPFMALILELKNSQNAVTPFKKKIIELN